MKLHYDEAQMEPAGVPAVIAYRGGEKFAGLVPIINELPDDADLSALTLEAVMKRFAILQSRRLRISLIAHTDTRSLPERPSERISGALASIQQPRFLFFGREPSVLVPCTHHWWLVSCRYISGTRRCSEGFLGASLDKAAFDDTQHLIFTVRRKASTRPTSRMSRLSEIMVLASW